MDATLLLVDDDRRQRTFCERELAEAGYRVLTAENGKEAVRRLETDPEAVDLVVLDIRMPDMDGIEALGKILNTRNTLPVILHTAYPHFKENFMSWAADAYVVKSSDLTELKARIQEILEKRGKPQPAM